MKIENCVIVFTLMLHQTVWLSVFILKSFFRNDWSQSTFHTIKQTCQTYCVFKQILLSRFYRPENVIHTPVHHHRSGCNVPFGYNRSMHNDKFNCMWKKTILMTYIKPNIQFCSLFYILFDWLILIIHSKLGNKI